MVVQIISRTLGICIALSSLSAWGQSHSIQEKIFENCEEAQKEIGALPQEDQKALLDFLVRVVGLNTQAPAAPEAFAVMPGGKPGDGISSTGSRNIDVSSPALWQTTDAKRELRGKRCALDLLTSSGALAFSITPRLATLYSEQPLSDEIAVGIEEATANIAEQAHRNGQTLTDEHIEQLVPYLITDRPLVTQNLLQEYIVLTLPRILTYLSNLPQSDADKLLPFLLEADPDGSRAMRTFLDLVPKLPTENANRLAGYLPFPQKDTLPALVVDFAKLASDDKLGNNITALIGKACASLGTLSLDPSVSALLGRNPGILAKARLSFDYQRCLVSSVPSLAAIVLPWISNGSGEEKDQALLLLPSALPLLDAERKGVVFTKVKELANDRHSPLNIAAITALTSFSDRKNEVVSALASLLKDAPAIKERSEESTTTAVWRALNDIPLSKEYQKMSPILLEAFQRDNTPDIATEVIAKIDSLEPALIKLSTNRSSSVASRALQALQKRKSINKGSLPVIVEDLRTPGTARAAEATLLTHGSSTAPLLRKALLKTSSTSRVGFLALLESFGTASKSERSELASSLVSAEGCSALEGRSKAIASLLNSELDSATSEKLVRKTMGCLCSIPLEDEKRLLATVPDKLFNGVDALKSTHTSTAQCASLRSSSIELIYNDAVALPVRTFLASEVLEKGTDAEKLALLTSIKGPSEFTSSILPRIRSLASGDGKGTEISYTAALCLALVGDSEFDWRRFVRSVIELPDYAPHYPLALKVIQKMPADIVLGEVTPALEVESTSKVAGACRVGAALGQLAIPIVSKVWNLREKRAPEIRYAAVLALLQINPLTPELHGSLRAILANRYYRSARLLAVPWRQCVAVVDLDKASFGTLRSVHLDRLLSER
jgi:hypothetical protein